MVNGEMYNFFIEIYAMNELFIVLVDQNISILNKVRLRPKK